MSPTSSTFSDCPCHCGRILTGDQSATADLAYRMLLTYRTLDSFDLAGKHTTLVQDGETFATTLIRHAHGLPVDDSAVTFTSDDLEQWLREANEAIGMYEPFGEENTETDLADSVSDREEVEDALIDLIDSDQDTTDADADDVIDLPEDSDDDVDEQAGAVDSDDVNNDFPEDDVSEDADVNYHATAPDKAADEEVWDPYPASKPKRRRHRLWGASSR